MRISAWFAALLVAVGLTSDVEGKPQSASLKAQPIEVSAIPFVFDKTAPQATGFGRLTWRGGVVLGAANKAFGGYSGIAITANGRGIIAVSDEGTWLVADLVYRNGHLAGLTNARIGPLTAKNGRRLKRKKYADAEEVSLWQRRSGTYALISFERINRIGRFPITEEGIGAPTAYVRLPGDVAKVGNNKGLEALTVLTDERHNATILTFAEKLLDKKGNYRGWLVRGSRSWPISLKHHDDDFEITGLATLPNSDVVILERSFSIFSGVQMRIRLIKAETIDPGVLLDGEILIRATMRYNIDNMEGISAHENKRGETILTLISDNNFNRNSLQRTLLMQFRLD